MGKGKLAKFAEMETFSNVFQYPYARLQQEGFPLKGKWENFFTNQHPIVLELGCGKGEYTVALARLFPQMNFIGIDIKGARLWSGARLALQEGLTNVAFVRTNIELVDHFFANDEVSEIWLTFSDPQMRSPRKRLTHPMFLNRYRQILKDNGLIHLKTDSNFLFTYTSAVVECNNLPVECKTDDLYHDAKIDDATREILSIKTYYEMMWLERGLNIKYLKFRLPHEGDLREPDIEIPLDDYRSYRRDKRSSLEKTK